MSLLAGLNPAKLWEHFGKICAINRDSLHEGQLIAHIINIAQEFGYNYDLDAGNNLVVYMAASPGKLSVPTICLQAHLDMVPVNLVDTSATESRVDTSAIELRLVNGKLKATETSLGADNGIGVAAMLTLMTDDATSNLAGFRHGEIELLFTSAEEIGMIGALALNTKAIKARHLINLDSEEWRKIFLGCAGGGRIESFFNFSRREYKSAVKIYELTIDGLLGGHSGVDIDKGHANAILLMVRVFSGILKMWPEATLVSFDGGEGMNAIPPKAVLQFAVREVDEAGLAEYISAIEIELRAELLPIEENFRLKITNITASTEVSYIPDKFKEELLSILPLLPNGVISRDPCNLSILQSSNNIGLITTEENQLQLTAMYRSSSDTHKEYLKGLLMATFQYLRADEIKLGSEYPAWVPKYSSGLLRLAQDSFMALAFGGNSEKMTELVVHAGLETALFCGYWPDMEIISIGPDIKYPHSAEEEVDIKSVEEFWQLLLKILSDFK